MGEDQFSIQVTGTGPPEVPFNLRLLNASATSLKIAWGQGFNGGHKQTFTVRINSLGSLSSRSHSIFY